MDDGRRLGYVRFVKIFIDAGFYRGKALEYYAPFLDDSWMVFAFEPNEQIPVQQIIDKFPFPIEWVKKAVWTEDGQVEFRLQGRDDASHIDGIRHSIDPKVTVPSIDFSRFIGELPEATIVCSMDIEGAEFPVLRKMLDEKTAQRISLLDIEFHHRLLADPDPTVSSLLRMELERAGVLVKLKLDI